MQIMSTLSNPLFFARKPLWQDNRDSADRMSGRNDAIQLAQDHFTRQHNGDNPSKSRSTNRVTMNTTYKARGVQDFSLYHEEGKGQRFNQLV